jgi:hypothetical protein
LWVKQQPSSPSRARRQRTMPKVKTDPAATVVIVSVAPVDAAAKGQRAAKHRLKRQTTVHLLKLWNRLQERKLQKVRHANHGVIAADAVIVVTVRTGNSRFSWHHHRKPKSRFLISYRNRKPASGLRPRRPCKRKPHPKRAAGGARLRDSGGAAPSTGCCGPHFRHCKLLRRSGEVVLRHEKRAAQWAAPDC